MKQTILYSKEARLALQKGADALADVVTATLGPSGHEVVLDLEPGHPIMTKDGVTVAKAVNLSDPIENAGAQMLKQASIKTGDEAGDGTTTATVLARAIVSDASGLSASGLNAKDKKYNSVLVRRGMEKAEEKIINYIREHISRPVADIKELKHVATVSANGDKQIGELISRALDEVGQDGAVTVEESKSGETYLDVIEGIQFKQGYKSPYFVTDNETMTAVLEDVVILLLDQRITQVKDLLPLLQSVAVSNKSLLIIADDVDGEALASLVMNKARGILKVAAVKAPEFGDRRKQALEDIAILTGGTVVSREKGMKLDKFDQNWLGTAKKVTVSRDDTTIIHPDGDKEAINKRIEEIKCQIDTAKSNYDKEQLQTRLARFAGGVAVLYVGGHTELEMKEKKDRVDDALHATKAALEEGICPGGGRALHAAAVYVNGGLSNLSSEPNASDVRCGERAVILAAMKPFKEILRNAGIDNVENHSDAVSRLDPWTSVDVTDPSHFLNMYDEGIVDPTKVIRLALKNAVSVAGTMITAEALVVNVPEKEDKETVPGMPGIV